MTGITAVFIFLLLTKVLDIHSTVRRKRYGILERNYLFIKLKSRGMKPRNIIILFGILSLTIIVSAYLIAVFHKTDRLSFIIAGSGLAIIQYIVSLNNYMIKEE